MNNYKIKITAEILNLLSELDEFKGKWQATNTISINKYHT